MRRKPTAHASPISAALAQMLEAYAQASPAADPTTVRLAHGRTLALGGDAEQPDCLVLRGRDGALEVTISIDARGTSVQVVGASLDLVATRDIEVRCASLRVQAELGVALSASRGDISLDAGDDVVIVGERVLLN